MKSLKLVLAILSLVSTCTTAQEIGVDICACSPRVYEMTFDFGLRCEDMNITFGQGVEAGTCLVTGFDDPEVTDLVPVAVSSVQFIEIGQEGTPLTVSQETGDFRDGSIVTYTSIVEEGAEIPLAFQARAIGRNSDGDTLIIQWALTYSNDCSIFPVLNEGEFIGWFIFTDLDPPMQAVCPLVPTISPAPTTLFPTISPAPTTDAPTISPAPTTSAPVTPVPDTEAPTTAAPTTFAPTTSAPSTSAPTTSTPTTSAPTTSEPTTSAPTTSEPTTAAPTTSEPTTAAPITSAPTTSAPTTASPTAAPDTPCPTQEKASAVPSVEPIENDECVCEDYYYKSKKGKMKSKGKGKGKGGKKSYKYKSKGKGKGGKKSYTKKSRYGYRSYRNYRSYRSSSYSSSRHSKLKSYGSKQSYGSRQSYGSKQKCTCPSKSYKYKSYKGEGKGYSKSHKSKGKGKGKSKSYKYSYKSKGKGKSYKYTSRSHKDTSYGYGSHEGYSHEDTYASRSYEDTSYAYGTEETHTSEDYASRSYGGKSYGYGSHDADAVHLTYSRVSNVMVESRPATYECTLTALWSGAVHPFDYPESAHYSPPVFASHDWDFTVWSVGSEATDGVQQVAETGNPWTLQTELSDAGDAVSNVVLGTAQWNHEVPGIPEGHIVGLEQTVQGITLDEDHTYLSTITMLAPSPDWFTGFSRFEPIENGMWLEYFSIDTQPYDAGTDDGTTFMSENSPTDPQGTISEITVDSPTGSAIFENAAGDAVEPVAMWTCTLCGSDDHSRRDLQRKDTALLRSRTASIRHSQE